MERSRPRRPSLALVISFVALFVSIGGTGYAALTLPKNSVGTQQLRKNAVTNSKIKNNAVTGAKVKDHSLTGADIKLSTLGTVPSAVSASHAGVADNATHAGSADNATNATDAGSADNAANATHAGEADTVGGVTVKGFNYQTPSNGGTATLFSLDGLTLKATCSAGRVDATTSVDHAYISSAWVNPSGTAQGASDSDFNTTDTFLANINTGPKSGSIEYVQPDGQRVSVSLQADMAVACTVSGHAFGSG